MHLFDRGVQEADQLLLPRALFGGEGQQNVSLLQLQRLPNQGQGRVHLAFLQLIQLVATTSSGQRMSRNQLCMVRSLAVGLCRASTIRTPAVIWAS